GRVVIGAGEEDAPASVVGPRGPDLLAVEHVVIAVAVGPRLQRRQVRAGVGLAEQLAPDLASVQQRRQPALLLLLGAAGEQGGPGPADAGLVLGAGDGSSSQL